MPSNKRKIIEILTEKTTETDHKAANCEKARSYKKVKRSYLKPAYPFGYKFNNEDKLNVLHIYHTLQTDKKFQALQGVDQFELTASLYGISKTTVKKIIDGDGFYPDNRKNRFIQSKDIPIEYKSLFQDEIKENLKKGIILTSKYFREILSKDGINVSRVTIRRKMIEWGIKWGTLVARDPKRRTLEILEKREKYLEQLAKLGTNKCRVYIDESFVNKNHSFSKGWYVKSEGNEILKPTGLGSRVAMIGAITQYQWLGARTQHIKKCLTVERENGAHEYKTLKYWKVMKIKRVLEI